MPPPSQTTSNRSHGGCRSSLRLGVSLKAQGVASFLSNPPRESVRQADAAWNICWASAVFQNTASYFPVFTALCSDLSPASIFIHCFYIRFRRSCGLAFPLSLYLGIRVRKKKERTYIHKYTYIYRNRVPCVVRTCMRTRQTHRCIRWSSSPFPSLFFFFFFLPLRTHGIAIIRILNLGQRCRLLFTK